MSQVNFVEQFNLFMQYAQRNKLTSYERIFYLGLFYCANDLARQTENFEWPDDYFPVSNMELNGWTGFDERAIRNTRNSLKQKGLLDFVKGDGKKRDPAYHIFYLRRIGYKIAPDSVGVTYTKDKNAGGRKKTGDKNAGDKRPSTKTADEFAHDAVGDTVGDPAPDTVGDMPVIGGEFAPDTVGDHFIISKIKHTNVNAKAGANAGSPATPPRPAHDPLRDPEFGRVMDYFMDSLNPAPSGIAIAGLKSYTDSLCADVVIHAIQICQDERHTSWAYLRKILMRYEREGIKTMLDVQRDEERRDTETSRKRPRRAPEPDAAGGYGLVDLDGGYEPAGGLVADYGRRW